MQNDLIRTIILSVVSYFFLLLLARIIGRKLISEMTYHDFIIGITIGSITATLVLTRDSLWTGLTMLVVFTVLGVLIGYSRLKSIHFNKLINSEPVVVIENNTIINENMKKARLSLIDLNMLLRLKNCFNIQDVEFAVLETTGDLSVLLKAEKQTVTLSDLKLAAPPQGLSRNLVMDGHILEENMHFAAIRESELRNQLKTFGVNDISEVFYAGLDHAGNLYVSKKIQTIEQPGEYGIE